MDANTLYPLMRRLEGQGLLASQWDTSEAKPRKYYQITEDVRVVLTELGSPQTNHTNMRLKTKNT